MKYTVVLVSCGLLALKVHGLVNHYPPVQAPGSEEQIHVEVDKFVDKLLHARASEESGCNGDDSTESKDDKCDTTYNTKFELAGAKEDAEFDSELEGEFKRSVGKILFGIKLILVDDVPLLYRSTFRCGKRFTFICQYTNNDTDDWFYGFQTVPGPTMLRVTDAINSFVSNSLVTIFASSIDQQYRQRAENGTVIQHYYTEEILQFVQSIVDRDPDSIPEKFACGYQVGKQIECSYDNPREIFGPELDLNDDVKRVANSQKFRCSVIKLAKEGSSAFPALRDSLKDKIIGILINP